MSKDNTELRLKHLFDGSEWNVYNSNILNLGVGAPGTDLLENCCDIFQKATQHRLNYERQHNSSMLFQYGPRSGTYEARSVIANYFSKIYGSEMKSEDLIITAGATQGLHLILSTLIDLNGFIFVDEVTYMLALHVIRPLRLNDDGVDLENFETALKAKKFKSKSKEFWAMYYAIPVFHNPTGMTFSDGVCRGLVALARKYDILISCDDVYNILQYKDNQPPKRLFAYDENGNGNVISNGSFSKIIGPGLRLGWLEVPSRVKPILDDCGIHNSGGCFNNYTSGIIASLFELELAQSHIQNMFEAYKSRMLATCDVLQKNLPAGCSMVTPRGGYFIWIRLPEYVDAVEFQKVCLSEERIYFIVGSIFSFEGKAQNCLRLSIAFQNITKLVDGAERFCQVLQRFLKQKH